MLQNIVLSGCDSLFPGLAELHSELCKLFPADVNVKIVAAPERRCNEWSGAVLPLLCRTLQLSPPKIMPRRNPKLPLLHFHTMNRYWQRNPVQSKVAAV
mmetsp:Transcript_21772/g.27742  ORF Transcript_21772/g.27742 Transcript_21772/m.27742 type:complete len:99 (-) Transcript_21772:260-556(-)